MVRQTPESKKGSSASGLVNAFLDRLDQAMLPGADDHRRESRLRYRLPQIRLQLQNAQGQWDTYTGPTRNISANGLGVILGVFAYPNTSVRFDLISLYGHKATHSGRVARCRYLPGTPRLYEVGIEFHTPVNVGMFARQEVPYSVLIVEPTQATRVTIEALLQSVPLSCGWAPDAAAAIRAAQERPFDLVLVAPQGSGVPDAAVADTLQQSGVVAPLVAIVRQGACEEAAEQCLAAGYDAWIKSPFDKADLLCLLRSMRCEPMVSTLLHKAEKLEFVDQFAQQAPGLIRELSELHRVGNWAQIIACAQATQANAVKCGFPLVGSALQELLETVQGNESDSAAVRIKLGFAKRLLNSVVGASCKLSCRPLAATPS